MKTTITQKQEKGNRVTRYIKQIQRVMQLTPTEVAAAEVKLWREV